MGSPGVLKQSVCLFPSFKKSRMFGSCLDLHVLSVSPPVKFVGLPYRPGGGQVDRVRMCQGQYTVL